ncbi:hypothetical protein CSC74_10240 [Pseudoxanthomonas yeongjuensis]|uniref:hypothetical protein n=1 Tax=Pseudoxanthomonas yeongjuensis TaxID=377616 RepID=UPI001B87028E|nr:hypothetical protein [Pseudoxanthomonas yeongjuensis]KAF1716222.1 hypothetical protein CSC74_10240 [Pseudoxanthomonas yeongjuensis]
MFKIGCFVLAFLAVPSAWAQETRIVNNETMPVAPTLDPAAIPVTGACCRVAEGTLVTLEIMEPLDSSRVLRGDKFRIRLAEPLSVDGNVVLDPGVEGVGEIVHAEKSRSGGKGGELLIAARYLDRNGTHVNLRGLKLGGKGKDNTGAALAVALALGPVGLFVHGREIIIPAGTLAQAKTAQEMQLAPAMPQLTDAAPVAIVASAPEQQAATTPSATGPSPPALSATLPATALSPTVDGEADHHPEE